MRQIIDATQLDTWFVSTKRRAQELLPHLVRKLIAETVPINALSALRIAVRDQVTLRDYDGRVETATDHLYVPRGKSVWEVGTGNPRVKAQRDYRKRTTNPEDIDPKATVFVFVTPHPWPDKPKWCARKKRDQVWKDVRAYDATDLEAWLEFAPRVGSWLAREMGIPVKGMRDLEAFVKEELDARYGREFPPELLLGGRDGDEQLLQNWIDSDSREIRIVGESRDEACAFATAVIRRLPTLKRDHVDSRLLFVDQPEALEYLSSLPSTHFVVALTPEVRRKAQATEGPAVRLIVPEPRSIGGGAQGKESLRLGSVRRQACEESLRSMRLPPHRVHRIAKESNGSLTAILWMLAEEDTPLPWTKGQVALELVPLVLAGQWAGDNESDQKQVEELAGRSYDDLKGTIARWTAPEGPLVARGLTWDWLAWDYAWGLLAPYIDRQQIDRFCKVAKDVLGTPDPKLELTRDDQWAASIYGKTHPFSSALRTGLVGSIVQFAVNRSKVRAVDGQSVANALVRDLLSGEDLPRKEMWLSLAPWLPDLAEGAPDAFLSALDAFLKDGEAVRAIFEEGGLFGSSPHVNLLWSLERLAWSGDLLTRVTLLLGNLAARDPSGTLSNRPANTLTEIYLPWHPQTTADVQHRLDAIDVLYEREPDVAWKLGVSLVPRVPSSASSTAEPRWRDWKHDYETKVTVQDYWALIEQLVARMIKWAGTSGTRWSDLLNGYNSLRGSHPPLAETLLGTLRKVDPAGLEDAERSAVTKALRSTLFRHREVPEAEWSMSEEELGPLQELYDEWLPDNASDQYGWVFASWPDFPKDPNETLEQHSERIRQERVKAVRTIRDAQGLAGLMAFAENVDRPDEVGYALAQLRVDDSAEAELLNGTLATTPTREGVPTALQFGLGFVRGRLVKDGDVWIDHAVSLVGQTWGANEFANLAMGLPAEGSTWDRLDEWGKEAEKLYWQRTPVQYVQYPERDLERAIRALLDAGRPYRAIDLACVCARGRKRGDAVVRDPSVATDLLLEALREAPKHDPRDELFAPATSMIGYHVGEVLDTLEGRGVQPQTLARLEWSWLPALEHTNRGIKALQHALSTDPALFVEALVRVYRGKNEQRQEFSEQDQAMATQASQLLHEWKRVPGTVEQEPLGKIPEGDVGFAKGRLDEEQLLQWVTRARDLAEERGRLAVCDIQIGNVLAHAPHAPDRSWPCEPVRNLIESLESKDLEQGVEVGIYNKRGVHYREKGGGQDRRLAAKFRNYAQQVRTRWPRTASMLSRIAEGYEREGKKADERDAIDEFE